MKTLRTLLAATVLTAIAGTAMADETVVKDGYAFDRNQLVPTGVRAEVGTTGYGGALLWTANPYVGLALGYNGGDISWTDDVSINGTKYDADMDNKLAYLNAEVRPWGTSTNRWAQGLYVAAGVGYVDSEYDLKKRSSDGTIKVNGNNYNFNGEVSGKMGYENNIAPYVGLGLAPKINQNWGVFGEVGAYYTGNPDVKLDDYNLKGVTGAKPINQAVADEQDKIANKSRYEWMPVAKVGVSFKF